MTSSVLISSTSTFIIIEENDILYLIEIKQGVKVTADKSSALTVLDKVENKKRGTGANICICPPLDALRENVLQIPVWHL